MNLGNFLSALSFWAWAFPLGLGHCAFSFGLKLWASGLDPRLWALGPDSRPQLRWHRRCAPRPWASGLLSGLSDENRIHHGRGGTCLTQVSALSFCWLCVKWWAAQKKFPRPHARWRASPPFFFSPHSTVDALTLGFGLWALTLGVALWALTLSLGPWALGLDSRCCALGLDSRPRALGFGP